MLAILSLVVVLILSFLITKVATIALTHTGLSQESARFQARSAFTGAGFTTSESESVVGHPVRRRIVQLLMLLGNAGIVTAVASLLLTFVGSERGQISLWAKLGLLLGAVALLWFVLSSGFVDRVLSRWIDRLLRKYTKLDVRDYASILQLESGYRLGELIVQEDGWLSGQSLGDAKLRDEGVVVLGIQRASGDYIGVPKGENTMDPGDRLFVYGREECLAAIDERRRGWTGDLEHHGAVEEQEEQMRQENEDASDE